LGDVRFFNERRKNNSYLIVKSGKKEPFPIKLSVNMFKSKKNLLEKGRSRYIWQSEIMQGFLEKLQFISFIGIILFA